MKCGSACSQLHEQTRSEECVECAKLIAASHESALGKYFANITEAANAKCFSADLLTGFISRVTNGGQDLDGSLGWIPCHNNPSEQCFGIMNLCKDRTPVTTDGFGGVEYLKHGISILIEQIDQIVLNHPDWNSGLFSEYFASLAQKKFYDKIL